MGHCLSSGRDGERGGEVTEAGDGGGVAVGGDDAGGGGDAGGAANGGGSGDGASDGAEQPDRVGAYDQQSTEGSSGTSTDAGDCRPASAFSAARPPSSSSPRRRASFAAGTESPRTGSFHSLPRRASMTSNAAKTAKQKWQAAALRGHAAASESSAASSESSPTAKQEPSSGFFGIVAEPRPQAERQPPAARRKSALLAAVLKQDLQQVVKDAARQSVAFTAQEDCTKLLTQKFFVVIPGGDDEKDMLDSLERVLRVLRHDKRQRTLVRRKLFWDAKRERAPPERCDPRPLARNVADWFKVAQLRHPRFLEGVLEVLSLFLLPNSALHKEALGKQSAAVSLLDDGAAESDQGDDAEDSDPRPRPREITYCVEIGLEKLLDKAFAHPALGKDPFLLLSEPTKSLVWALELYVLLVSHSESVLRHAIDTLHVRTAWDIVSRKTSVRERAGRVFLAKRAALELLRELGRATTETPEAMAVPGSILTVNVNSRSMKEVMKLMQGAKELRPLVVRVLCMITQKGRNSLYLKRQGMFEYFVSKVLPDHVPAPGSLLKDSLVIPQLLVLINAWAIHPEDLRYLSKFDGVENVIRCMQIGMAVLETSETDPDYVPVADLTLFEDMLMHGVSLLFKLCDSRYPETCKPQFHEELGKQGARTMLLQCVLRIGVLKSGHHMNTWIAAVRSLSSLAHADVDRRWDLTEDTAFPAVVKRAVDDGLPADCLLNLLELLEIVMCDTEPQSDVVDDAYRAHVVAHVVDTVLRPVASLLSACPLPKPRHGPPEKIRITCDPALCPAGGIYTRAGDDETWFKFNGHPIWERSPDREYSIILGADHHWWVAARSHLSRKDWKTRPPRLRSSDNVGNHAMPHFDGTWGAWDLAQRCFVLAEQGSVAVRSEDLDKTQLAILALLLRIVHRAVGMLRAVNPLLLARYEPALPREVIGVFCRVTSDTPVPVLAKEIRDAVWRR